MNTSHLFPPWKRRHFFNWSSVAVAGAGMLLVFYLTGCHKKTAAEPAAPASAMATEAAAPAGIPVPAKKPVAVSVPADARIEVALAQLTQVLRRFSVEHRRVPQSLDELVSSGYLAALPAAPAGMKFTFDKRLEVTLENR